MLVLLSHLKVQKLPQSRGINAYLRLRRYLWVEDMSRKRVPIDGNVWHQKALSLYEDFSKGPLKRVMPSHLLQVRDGYTDSGTDVD